MSIIKKIFELLLSFGIIASMLLSGICFIAALFFFIWPALIGFFAFAMLGGIFSAIVQASIKHTEVNSK